jgi:enoyl-CoA hydratase/carnithine racemase
MEKYLELQQLFEQLNSAELQQALMRVKYSRKPVVVAPFRMTLGGGCETCLSASAVRAYAETYMGLVEMGVGIIPAGKSLTTLSGVGERITIFNSGTAPAQIAILRSNWLTICIMRSRT